MRIYLSRTERKYIFLGDSSLAKWMIIANSTNVKEEKRHCEQILVAMKLFGEDMTIQNFDLHYKQNEEKQTILISDIKPNAKDTGNLDFLLFLSSA